MTQIVVLCFCVLLLLGPLYEIFDRWDSFPQGGDDTVLSLIALVCCCGLFLALARSLPELLVQLLSSLYTVWSLVLQPIPGFMMNPDSTIGKSPPPLLLSSLRI